MLLQQSLDGHGQLSQEALDDGAAFGKFVLHLDLQDIRGQRDETKPLRQREREREREREMGQKKTITN